MASFWNTMKRGFGFGTDDDDMTDYEESILRDDKSDGNTPQSVVSDNTIEKTDSSSHHEGPESEPVPVEVIDGILQLINASLPPVVKENLDVERQRRFLYERVGDNFKAYARRLAETADADAARRSSEERNRLAGEMEALRTREHQAEQQRAEQQNRQLSAERQKRALTVRVQDLEKQVATLEAEREQFQIETKSLVNRLKVAEVKDSDLSAFREEANAAKEDLNRLKSENVRLADIVKQKDARIAELESDSQQPVTVVSGISEEDRRMIEEIREQVLELERDSNAKDDRIALLESELTARDGRLESLTAELAERDRSVEAQSQQLRERESRISELQEQIGALQRLIQDLSTSQALAESLRERREATAASPDHEAETTAVTAAEPAKRQRRRKSASRPKISAIDDNLGSVDWLIPGDHPDAQPAKSQQPIVSDAEFGYQPPTRRESPAFDDQPSLF